ncbi:MAG: hypothetical protein KDA57_05205 [Planctomycetales bacterium]|nr:hypothetical protein [Planctomycetales bacterium]
MAAFWTIYSVELYNPSYPGVMRHCAVKFLFCGSSMILDVPNIDSPRFSTGVSMLRERGGFRLDGVEFAKNGTVLECRVQSSWNPENLTDEFALRDLTRAQSLHAELISQSNDFAEATAGLTPRVSLIDDYGMGCVELAQLHAERVKWTNIPSSIYCDIPKLMDYLSANGFRMNDATIGSMHSYSITFAGPNALTITCDRGQLFLGGERSELEGHGLWKTFDSFPDFEDAVIRFLSRT